MLNVPISKLDRWLLAGVTLLALAGASLALRPDATVFLKPLSEDGYYSLAIARNIGAGLGITIDGVTPTNGFQPLLTFIQSGLFALARGNDLLALRFVLAFYWLLYLGTAAMLGWIAAAAEAEPARKLTAALATSLVYLGASYLFLHHFNGLETGLSCSSWPRLGAIANRAAPKVGSAWPGSAAYWAWRFWLASTPASSFWSPAFGNCDGRRPAAG